MRGRNSFGLLDNTAASRPRGNACKTWKEKYLRAKLSIKGEDRREVFLDMPSLETFIVNPHYSQITYLQSHLLIKICV